MSRSPGLALTLAVAAGAFAVVVAFAVRAGSAPGPAGATAAPAPSAITASYRDGTLTLRPGGESRRAVLVAHWPVEDVPEDGHGYRTARLEPPDEDEPKEATRGLRARVADARARGVGRRRREGHDQPRAGRR